MSLSPSQPLKDILEKHTSYLLVLPQHPSVDALGAGLALHAYLSGTKKTVSLVASQFVAQPHHAVLPNLSVVSDRATTSHALTIAVELGAAKLEKLSYEVHNQTLKILLTPKEGTLHASSVHVPPSSAGAEVLITLGATTLEDLGDFFHTNAEMVYATPIVNIDYHADNSNFGTHNHVDGTAASTSEVVGTLLQQLNSEGITTDMATNLLAGLIDATGRFSSPRVTPTTLRLVSTLLERGARHDHVFQHLFQTKSLGLLRQWGAILRTIRSQYRDALLIADVDAAQQIPAAVRQTVITRLIEELLTDTPAAKVIAVFFHMDDGAAAALVRVPATLDTHRIWSSFHPERHNGLAQLHFATTDIRIAEKELIASLHDILVV